MKEIKKDIFEWIEENRKDNVVFLLHCISADWNKYGRAAGPIRNEQMVKDCDYCLILWDGSSRGTKNDIDLCERYGKKHKVVIKNSN